MGLFDSSEKVKLFKRFNDVSNLQFNEIDFIDFEHYKFVELFEHNKDFEYFFIEDCQIN